MDGPAALGEQLTFALEAGVRVPELSLENKPTGRRRAASVRDRRRVLTRVHARLARAGGDVGERRRERQEGRTRPLGEQDGDRDEGERGRHVGPFCERGRATSTSTTCTRRGFI